jgi:hypothetical protein
VIFRLVLLPAASGGKILKSILGGCEQREGECSPQRIGENDNVMAASWR